jgi:hypothetical protein
MPEPPEVIPSSRTHPYNENEPPSSSVSPEGLSSEIQANKEKQNRLLKEVPLTNSWNRSTLSKYCIVE